MSAPPVCARPDWTVAEAARLMESQRVRRLLVVFTRLIPVVERLCRTVDGLVHVAARLAYETDDTALP